MTIERYFPTCIGITKNEKSDFTKIRKLCKEIQKNEPIGGRNWISSNTYNTCGTHSVHENEQFSDINSFVENSVQEYKQEMNMTTNLTPIDSWFCIYEKGDYQEYHNHPNSLISVVYFPDNSKDKIHFKSPCDDMIIPNYDKFTINNYERISFQPTKGLCLVFRSYLIHCVEKVTKERISFSYNYG